MNISKKIESEIQKMDKPEPLKKLMLQILEEEAKGLHNFKSKYDELINKYIEEFVLGVTEDDKN